MKKRDFLIDINPHMELPKYDLVLTKLNGEPLQELHNIEDFEISKHFADIDEISFTVPFYITENDGTNIKNELYDLVDGSMMVLLNDMQYFILTQPSIQTDEQTGEITKEVTGFSREYELAQKRVSGGYDLPSRKLYTRSDEKDEEGNEVGVLNYLLKTTSWDVDYVSSDLLNKYRHLNFSRVTYLQAFQDIQRTFGCLFQYDTINKRISIYESTQLGNHKGMYISDKNFIKSLNQEVNHDEIKTRLYLYGQDNISVQSINITGQPYIDNFSFYKNTRYMSQNLIDKLDSYNDYIETKESEFNAFLAQLDTLNDNLSERRIELAALITELKIIESDLDIAITTGEDTTELRRLQSEKIDKVNNKQLEIETLVNDILAVHVQIDEFNVDVSLNTHLTEQEAIELDPFIREDEFSDSNYTEHNLEELLEEGKKIQSQISYPQIQFDVDVQDFLSLVEAQHTWDRFILGDIVTLEHEEIGFNYNVRMINYTHNPDSNSLELIFSNKDSIDDPNVYLKDLIEGTTTTAGTVDFNKYKWDKGEEANHIINEYVNEALDLARQQIVREEGQKPILDERGLWLAKEYPDGSVDSAQMRLVHNCLAITKDDWNTLEVAVSAENGINANLIRGKLGQFAEVQANQIVVGDDGETIPDEVLGGSLVKQNHEYNKTKITENEGIEVYDSINRRRIQIGGIDTTGNGVKNDYGFKAFHNDGTFSAAVGQGFVRKWPYGEAKYLNDIWVGEYGVGSSDKLLPNPPPLVRCRFSNTFRGREASTEIFLVPKRFEIQVAAHITSSGEVYDFNRIILEKVRSNFNVSQPYVDVRAHIALHEAINVVNFWTPMEFVLILVGR